MRPIANTRLHLVAALGFCTLVSFSPLRGALLPEGAPPPGMTEGLRRLAPAFRGFVSRRSEEDVLRLKKQVFFLERPFAVDRPGAPQEAVSAFLRGDWDGAEALWSGHAPEPSSRALLFRAYLAFARKDFEVAEKLFEGARATSAEDAPESTAAVYGLALTLLRRNGDEGVLLRRLAEEGEEALRKGKLVRAEDRLDLAWAWFFLGEHGRAARACRKIFPAMQKDPRLFYLYGKVLQATGKLAEARKAYVRAIDLGAAHPEVSAAYATVSMALGATGAAAEEVVAAEMVYGGADGERGGEDAWYLRRPENLTEGLGASGQADLKRAATLLGRCRGFWSSEAEEGEGDVAVMRGIMSKACRSYARAVAADPLNMVARVKGACANLLSGKIGPAFDLWIEAVDLTAVPFAERALARLQDEQEELLRAMSDCFSAYLYEAQARLKTNFDDGEAHRRSAAVFHGLHFYGRALRAARVVRRKMPADLEGKERFAFALWHDALYARRSLTAPRLKELAEILDELNRDKPSGAADYVLAMTRKALGEEDLARAALKRALGRKIDAPTVLFPLARSAREEGRLDDARDLYERLFRREFASRSSVMAAPAYRSLLRMIAAASGKGGSK